MRHLHVVSPGEKFVASGEYRYWRDDTPLKVSEKFSIHELPGGAFLYRVDEDGRDEDGLTILSEALISPEGQFERFNVNSFNPRDLELAQFKADYAFYGEYVQIGRQVEGGDRQYEEFALIDNCEIYIKQTIYMGLTLAHILANDDKSHVFAPALLSSGQSVLQKIAVKERGTETLMMGRKSFETRKYQIADDVYYWLDSHGIPIQRAYRHEGADYTVRVTNYAHR